MKKIKATMIMLMAATVMVMTVGILNQNHMAYGQVPEHCRYSQEHACAVPNEEQAQQILEVFPDAIVIVDEELYESIPEEDREDAEGIIESGARSEGEEEDSGESGSSSGGGDILPGER